jgi:hypothetical protein
MFSTSSGFNPDPYMNDKNTNIATVLPVIPETKTSPETEVISEKTTETVKTNFTVQVPFSTALADEFDYGEETAFLPSNSSAITDEIIKDIPKTRLAETQQGKEWVGALNAGMGSVIYNDGLGKTAARSEANFVQGVESPQGILTASAPTFKSKEDTKFTGDRARLRIRQALKLGVIFNVPLWHSGFWIRIKAPSEGALLELYRQMTSDKVTLGRATYGLIFSNNTSYAARVLLDFVIDNMYESSLAIKEGDNIRNYIKTPDLPILLWGLACSIYSNGFQYTRACISDPEKCNHILKEKLDLSKLLWTDSSALTAHQVNHMTKRQRGSMETDSLKRYTDEFIRGQKNKINLTDDVSITIKIPTIVEHIDSGYRWINTIEENYGKALIQDETKRDDYLISQGKATVMRQYAHFVESIEVAGDVYDDTETLEDVLNDLTASDKIRTAFMDKIAEYVADSTVSMIAIPTYTCPSCGGNQSPAKTHSAFSNLIPLDIIPTFFTLLLAKLRKIEAR